MTWTDFRENSQDNIRNYYIVIVNCVLVLFTQLKEPSEVLPMQRFYTIKITETEKTSICGPFKIKKECSEKFRRMKYIAKNMTSFVCYALVYPSLPSSIFITGFQSRNERFNFSPFWKLFIITVLRGPCHKRF